MRWTLWGVLAALLLLIAAAPAHAEVSTAAPAIVAAEAGFGGIVKSGDWVPVTLTLQNDGPEFAGELQYERSVENGPYRHDAAYRVPVVLPAGATKQVTLAMRVEMAGSSRIILADGDGQPVAETTPPMELTNDMVAGVLGVEPSELAPLGGIRGQFRGLRLVPLDPLLLPADPLLLASLDLVLVDRFAYADMAPEQQQALQAWVEHGGTLILAGGPEAKLEGLAPWLLLTVNGVETVPVAGVGEAPLSVAELATPDWQAIRSAGDRPLVARHSKGGGVVYFLAFDPALEPFASWAGLPDLIKSLLPGLAVTGVEPGLGPGQRAMALGDALVNGPGRELPDTRKFIQWLVLYALLAGPAHLLLARRRRRFDWALVSLPLLAMAAGGGSILYARQALAADVVVQELSLIMAEAEGTSLKVYSLAGIHMPPDVQHKVSVGDALLTPAVLPVPFAGQEGRAEAPLTTALDSARTADFAAMDERSVRAVGAEALLPVGSVVSGTLTVDGVALSGQLRNHLPFALRDVIVVSGGSFVRIGDLAAGGEAAVELPLSGEIQQGGEPLVDVVHQAYQLTGWGPEGPTREQMALIRRQQLAWAAAAGNGWTLAGRWPPAFVLGWVEEAPLPVTVDGRAVEAESLALYAQPLSYRFGGGAFELPTGFLSPRVADGSESIGGTPGLLPGWGMALGGSVTLEFQLPQELERRVVEIDLRAPSFGRGPSGLYPLSLQLYNWRLGRWVPAETEERTGYLSAEGLVGPDGVVRARLEQVADEYVPLGIPGLAIRGREG